MSLRARLVVGMAVVAVVLIATAGFITRSTEANLVDQLDRQLETVDAPRRGFRPGGPGGADRYRGVSTLYVAVVGEDGTLETITRPNLSADELALPRIPAERLAGGSRTGRPFTVGSEDSDLRYRVVVEPGGPDGRTFVLALPLNDVDAAIDRLVRVEVVVTLLVLGLLALVTFWVVRLGVRPIKAMTATATAIAGGDLSRRVPAVQPGTEAGELGAALNTMMGRIEHAFDERTQSEERLRRFVGDASHELRTPVTTIRGYAELYRSGGLDDPEELREAMRRTEQEATRMGALVDDLLLLARLDQGRPLESAPVDLWTLADDAAHDARAVQPDRPVAVVGAGPVVVVGDEGRLRQVVANLLANALVHTSPVTSVELRVGVDGGHAVLEVHDDGPGMAPDTAERAFERFYRADPSRSRHHGGSGLGLSIVAAITEAHDGTVALRSTLGEGTTVRLTLPTAPS